MTPVKCVHIFLLVASVALVTGQQQPKKEDLIAGKRYREQEPQFSPPPLPVQRRQQVFSNAEHPPSFFQQADKVEARQIQDVPQPQFQQQPNFQQQQQFQQRQQVQPVPNEFQFNQQPQQQQQQQNFQQQQPFPDQSNNFQARQQETLPTLPPVFIPPNQPVGPAPALQSPIRNLFREPEPSFSLSGLLQRFLRLFNFGNNNN